MKSQGTRILSLDDLSLTDEQTGSLRRQGFVATDTRCGRTYYQLRFRSRGKQVVRYLGTNPMIAEQIRRELKELQRERRIELELRAMIRDGAVALRTTKDQIEPELRNAGFAFHGFAIRRTRANPVLPT